MVINSTFAPVDFAVTVLVYEFDITGAVCELVAFKRCLVYNTLVRHIASTVPAHIGLSVVTVGLEAPDIAEVLAFGIVTACGKERINLIGRVVPLGDFGACITDVECSVYVGVAEAVVPVKGDFPAVGAEFAVVAVRSVCTENRRKLGARAEHVFGSARVPVERYIEAVVEEAEVEACVDCFDAFP